MKLYGLALAWALAGAAMADTGVKTANPADARAAYPPLRFDSGLRQGKAAAEVDPPKHWREFNDRARATGGHAGHLRASGAAETSVAPNAGARDVQPQGDAK